MVMDLPKDVDVVVVDHLAIAGGIDGPREGTKRWANLDQRNSHVSRQKSIRKRNVNSKNSQAKWIEVPWNDSLQIQKQAIRFQKQRPVLFLEINELLVGHCGNHSLISKTLRD